MNPFECDFEKPQRNKLPISCVKQTILYLIFLFLQGENFANTGKIG